MAENLQEFFFGNRLTLRVQITKPGDLGKGILDFGTIQSAEGAQFEGYLAALRFNEDMALSMVLDHGTLKLPDGRVFTGDFTIAHEETWKYTYYEIVPGAQIPFTKLPMLFYGTISYSSGLSHIPPITFDDSAKPMTNPNAGSGELVWAMEDIYKFETTAIDQP